MKRPKLVHISSSLACGGAERVLCTLVAGLRDQFEQTVLFVHDGPIRQELLDLGIRVLHVRGSIFRYDPSFFVRLYKLVRMEQPDVIHTLLWAANVAGRIVASLLRIPVVSAYHNNVAQDGYVRQLFDMLTLYQATSIIAVSNQVAHGLATRLVPARQQVQVITNGIVYQQSDARSTRASLGIPEHAWVVGAVGRFVPIKRFDVLIDAVAQVHRLHGLPIHMLLIGYGPLYTAYKQQVAALGCTSLITFIEQQPAQDYMHLMDVFVQPSEREGVSLALLEAMVYKRLCIVMAEGGKHPVITNHVDGLCVDGLAVHDLAKMLVYAYEHHQELQILSQAAADRVYQQFGHESMIAKYAKEFNRIIDFNRV